jgi:hypothetical protein
MVAKRYAIEHQELVADPDAVAVLPRLVWDYGEPFADPIRDADLLPLQGGASNGDRRT